jgi:hypothetical protein
MAQVDQYNGNIQPSRFPVDINAMLGCWGDIN